MQSRANYQNERVQEDLRMRNKAPNLTEDIIRKVRIYFDNENDLVIDFENFTRRYAIVVVLKNNRSLGWKECKAIADCMKIASRGTAINNTLFSELCRKLQETFGSVRGPFFEQGRIAVVLSPGTGSVKIQSSNVISKVSMTFDVDRDIVFEAKTYDNTVYTIILGLDGSDFLYIKDCKALIDILYFLETGDDLSPDNFLCCLYILRNRYNILKLGTDEHGYYKALVLASSTPSNVPIPQVILDALERRDGKAEQPKEEQAPEATTNQGDQSGKSPYPGITYTKKLAPSGQAQVYQGLLDRKKVAVKVFTGETPSQNFKNELKMLLKMPEHDNVIGVLDFFENPKPALVVRWIDGAGDLLELLENSDRMSEKQAREIAIGIAEGLAHLHKSGIVHRDMKPANVLMERIRVGIFKDKLRPVIIDLGLGNYIQKSQSLEAQAHTLVQTFAHDRSQQTGQIKGSLFWICPEMIRKCEWSEKTDVYSFGIMLWELLSGDVPYNFDEITSQVDLLIRVSNGLRPDITAISDVDPELQRLVVDCWAEHPRDRPTMMQVLDRLRGNDPKAIFERIDIDNDGGLDFPEFAKFLKEYAPQVKNSEMSLIFESIDDDNNEHISFEEFSNFWKMVQKQSLGSALEVYKRTKDTKMKMRDDMLSK